MLYERHYTMTDTTEPLAAFLRPKRFAEGLANPNAKLTPEIVMEIFETRQETGASAARIADAVRAKYGVGVSRVTVHKVMSGEAWRSVIGITGPSGT